MRIATTADAINSSPLLVWKMWGYPKNQAYMQQKKFFCKEEQQQSRGMILGDHNPMLDDTVDILLNIFLMSMRLT